MLRRRSRVRLSAPPLLDRHAFLAAGFLLSILVLLSTIEVAEGITFQDPEPVEIGDEPEEIPVTNDTDTPVTVNLVALIFDAKLADGIGIAPDREVLLITPSIQVPARDSQMVPLVKSPSVKLAPGTYRGVVRATAEGGPAPVEHAVEVIELTAPALTVVEPAFEKWTVIDYREGWPLKDLNTLPTTKGNDLPDSLGYVGDGAGHFVEISGKISEDNPRNVLIEHKNSYAIGTFDGTIDFQPTLADAGDLTLTVRHTRQPQYVLGLMGLGLMILYVAQRFVGVRRELGQIRRGAEESLKTIDRGHDLFEAGALGTPLVEFSWKESARDTYAELDRGISNLSWRYVFTLDKSSAEYLRVKGLEKDLSYTAATVNQNLGGAWATTYKDLTAIHVGETPITPPSGALTAQPVWVTEGLKILGPLPRGVHDLEEEKRKLTGIQDLKARYQERRDAFDVLVTRLERLASQVGMMDEASAKAFYDARRLVYGLSWDIWHARDEDDLLKRALESETYSIDETLGRLSEHLIPVVGNVNPEFLAGLLPRQAPGTELASTAGPPAATIRPSPDRLMSSITKVAARAGGPILSASVVTLSLAAILWAGLQTLYFDKAWGTPRDMISAVVWGIAGKAVLDVVANTIQKLRAPDTANPEAIIPSTGSTA